MLGMRTAVRAAARDDETVIDVRSADTNDVSADPGGVVITVESFPDESNAEPMDRRSSDRPLHGKVAVVTGGSSGIGREIALGLVEAGARVCIVGRDVARLRGTSHEAGVDAPLLYLQCDLGSASDIDSVADFIDRFDRPVDILVHSAGVQVAADVATGTVVDLDEQYLVNLRGPYLLSQKMLPQLQVAGGHIVFLNSVEGLRADAGSAQFAMTKHGLRGLADSLRGELAGTAVRVTSVFAGGVRAPSDEVDADDHDVDDVEGDADSIAPGDVAACVVQALQMPRSVQITDLRVVPTGARR